MKFFECSRSVKKKAKLVRSTSVHRRPVGCLPQRSPRSTYEVEQTAHRICGYAASSSIKLVYSVLQNLKFHAMYRARRTMYEPPHLIPATLLRAKVLEQLQHNSGVDSNLIIRTRYKTGSPEEFYTNCGLPFDSTVDWSYHCVWVPEKGFLAHLHEYFAIGSDKPAPIRAPAKPAGA